MICWSLAMSSKTLEALRVTGAIGSIHISGERITDLGSFEVTSFSSEMIITRTGLQNLDAFAQHKAVTGTLAILENSDLTDVDGLGQLEVSGGLVFRDNPALARLPSFDALSRLKSLMIWDNAVLSELPAFAALNADLFPSGFEESARDLLSFRPDLIDIRGNPALRQFDVPAGWQSGSFVNISNNAALERLGLGQLAAIDRLEIEANPALADVDLGALATVDSLLVQDNPQLDGAMFDVVQTFTRSMSGNATSP